jgi:hypothetical protein
MRESADAVEFVLKVGLVYAEMQGELGVVACPSRTVNQRGRLEVRRFARWPVPPVHP